MARSATGSPAAEAWVQALRAEGADRERAAARLRACGPCADDLEGLLAAVRADPES